MPLTGAQQVAGLQEKVAELEKRLSLAHHTGDQVQRELFRSQERCRLAENELSESKKVVARLLELSGGSS